MQRLSKQNLRFGLLAIRMAEKQKIGHRATEGTERKQRTKAQHHPGKRFSHKATEHKEREQQEARRLATEPLRTERENRKTAKKKGRSLNARAR